MHRFSDNLCFDLTEYLQISISVKGSCQIYQVSKQSFLGSFSRFSTHTKLYVVPSTVMRASASAVTRLANWVRPTSDPNLVLQLTFLRQMLFTVTPPKL